jgi:SAM-dependent methyltransferase
MELGMEIQKSNEPVKYLEFEREGWGTLIEKYDETFGAVTRQSADVTLDACGVRRGSRMLDVCCGPGMLSAAAVGRGAYAIGLDFPGVVSLAEKLVPGAQFQSGDATNLPFDENYFDAVVCGYGIMHVPDAQHALREMLRVLKPGGRLALTVWDSESISGLGVLFKAIMDHANMNVPMPHGPSIFQFSTFAKMRELLLTAGFADVQCKRHAQNWRLPSGTHFLCAAREGTVRTGAILAAQSEEAFANIVKAFEDALRASRTLDGLFDIPMPAIVGSGSKA